MPARGTTALYRPVPNDFDETFIRLGWSSICEHYCAGWATVVKWMALRGRDRLRAARADYVRLHGPAREPRMIAERGCRRPSGSASAWGASGDHQGASGAG